MTRVIRGDMSIAGPRPMVTASLDEMHGGMYFACDAQLVGRTIVTILAVLFHARLPEQKEYTLCRERLNAAE